MGGYITMKYLFIILLSVFFASSSFAFNDDSLDSRKYSAVWESFKGICGGGKTVKDTKNERFSCKGDKVRLDTKSKNLYKNGQRINRKSVRDFKVSRNGKVFYRDQKGNLYDERGKLRAGNSRVSLYLVSASGDVVYLNQEKDLFKNGKKLSRKAAQIPVARQTIRFRTQRHLTFTVITNPAVTSKGIAVYRDIKKRLFVEGKQISSSNIQVRSFTLKANGDVYYRDENGKRWKNGKRISK